MNIGSVTPAFSGRYGIALKGPKFASQQPDQRIRPTIHDTFEQMIIELLQGKSNTLSQKLAVEDPEVTQLLFIGKAEVLARDFREKGKLPGHIHEALAFDLGFEDPKTTSIEEIREAARKSRENPDTGMAGTIGPTLAKFIGLD